MSIFERRGAEQVNEHSDTQDGMTLRSITRIFDDNKWASNRLYSLPKKRWKKLFAGGFGGAAGGRYRMAGTPKRQLP